MSKILTTIFLTISILLSGLVLATPTVSVSAFPADTLRCTPAGQYIDANSAGRECYPCPVDYYCAGQVRAGQTGLFSPEKPGKDGKLNSEVTPCPSGTTTIGNTRNPARGYSLMTKDEDGFKVGTLALDPSECKPKEFTCQEPTPVKTTVNNILGCYAKCEVGTTEVIKNNIRSCIKECRDDAITAYGKCFDPCPNGATLTIVDGIANCNNKCETSKIRGQVVGPKGDCVCPADRPEIILDQDSPNTGRCGVKVITSSSSSSSSSSSVTPPVNCTITGAVRTNGSCVCPTGTYAIVAANGTKSCGNCPVGNTVENVSVENTGEIVYKCTAPVVTTPTPTNNGGGEGFCGGWWLALCGIGAYLLIDAAIPCFGIIGGCDSPKPVKPEVTTTYGFGPKICTYPKSVDYFGNCSCPSLYTDTGDNCIEPKLEIDVTPPNPTVTYQCQKDEIQGLDIYSNTTCTKRKKVIKRDCAPSCPEDNPFVFNYGGENNNSLYGYNPVEPYQIQTNDQTNVVYGDNLTAHNSNSDVNSGIDNTLLSYNFNLSPDLGY
jgi:hypothetical protein